jgi:hypothetical protein
MSVTMESGRLLGYNAVLLVVSSLTFQGIVLTPFSGPKTKPTKKQG